MAKRGFRRDKERERRILDEIVVDAHDPDEEAMAWYSYIEDRLQFPFTARCVAKRAISPLRVDDEVEAIRLPAQHECAHEMFVTIRWGKDGLAVPLSQLKPASDTEEETLLAVADWHYWARMSRVL